MTAKLSFWQVAENMVLPRPLRGIITATVTPLKEGPTLDSAGLERLLEHLIRGGVHGVFILGTTGEAPALPYSLRFALIEQTCKLVDGRVPVLVGITDTSYEDSLKISHKAEECGALGVVSAPPYYYRVTQGDLLDYYTKLASDVALPLFLYNAPSNTHHTLDIPTVVKAARSSNIVGLKDSGANMSYFHTAREALREFAKFSLLVGPEELLAEAVLMGAHGGMAAGSNVWPRLFVALYEAAVSQDINRVAALHRQAVQFGSSIYRTSGDDANPLRGLKCALSVLGICSGQVTRPFRPYSPAEQEQVRRYLDEIDLSAEPQMSTAAL
jgi:4-hydroxy-tetrahydrodipicolinate synthase